MLDISEKIASSLLIPEGLLCFRASLVWAGKSDERDIIFCFFLIFTGSWADKP